MATIAVIKTGGKQYKVKEGDTLRIEKLEIEAGKAVSFDEVLLIADESGSTVTLGEPNIKGATVKAKVLAQGRAKKVDVRKFKAKTRYYKRYGHRQPYTEVQIEKIAAK